MKASMSRPPVLAPLRALGFSGLTLGMLSAYQLHRRLIPRERDPALFDSYRHRWLGYVLDLFGVDLTLGSELPPPATGARLVVSNHRSALDIAVLLWMFGGNIVSRGDIASWPLIGTIAKLAGTIFVDRSEGMSRATAARAIRRRLSEGGSVVMFPEGTTFGGDQVRVFHPGVFGALRGLQVEIVPVGLAYEPGIEWLDESFAEHLNRTAGRRRTRVVACVGTSRSLGEDPKVFAKDLRDDVQKLVETARIQLDGSK
jgi:lyso-ornithine lipid O-acyltransferase